MNNYVPDTVLLHVLQILSMFIYFVQLTLRACDNGIPKQCIIDELTIIIKRDQFPPSLQQDPFTFIINDDKEVDTLIGTVIATDDDLLVSWL